MSTENGEPENGKPKESELPDAATKLYVKEQCDKARKEAIGIFAFIAVILAIGTGLGIWNGARAYIDDLMKGDQIRSVRARAESSALAAANSASTAQNAAERAQLEVTGETERGAGQISKVRARLFTADMG
jgi:hypothetical protein